jgi:hypothetical protein
MATGGVLSLVASSMGVDAREPLFTAPKAGKKSGPDPGSDRGPVLLRASATGQAMMSSAAMPVRSMPTRTTTRSAEPLLSASSKR